MKIVVVGHGWIAGKMMHVLKHHSPVQVTHDDSLRLLRTGQKIDWVVNAAGYCGEPNVDACERYRAKTIEANTAFPIRLAQACEKRSRLLHFSSGCIFTGGEFNEYSPPNFDGSVYSASKMISDKELQSKAVVCRIRMPFDRSSSHKNLLVKLRHYAASGKILDGFNSISDADEMAQVAADMIALNMDNGVYHLVNQGGIATSAICAMMGLHARYWDKAEFARTFPAPRSECTLTTTLRTKHVEHALWCAIEAMKEAA